MFIYGCGVTHTFPLDNVERIEIIRGAASSVYGSDALGGVINIVTREATEDFEGSLQMAGGSFGTSQYNLQVGGKENKTGYYLTFNREESDGHRQNSEWTGESFTGKFTSELTSRYKAAFFVKQVRADKNEPGLAIAGQPIWVASTPTAFNKYDRGAEDVTISGDWKNSSLSLKLYRSHGKHRFSDGWDSRDDVFGTLFQYSISTGGHDLTIGAEHRRLTGRSVTPLKDEDKNESSYFINDNFLVSNRLSFNAGARLNVDEIYGNETAPQIGMVYRFSENTNLRLNASKAYRSPTLKDLYWFPPSNTLLEPETAWNYEAGLSHSFSPKFKASISIFRTELDNLLTTKPGAPPRFVNTGAFDITGFETGFDWKPERKTSFSLYYSNLNPERYTAGRPGSKWDLSVRRNSGRLAAAVSAQSVSDYFAGDDQTNPISDFTVWNLRLNYPSDSNMRVFLNLDNLFDRDYDVYAAVPGIATGAYPMPGRTVTLGVRADF